MLSLLPITAEEAGWLVGILGKNPGLLQHLQSKLPADDAEKLAHVFGAGVPRHGDAHEPTCPPKPADMETVPSPTTPVSWFPYSMKVLQQQEEKNKDYTEHQIS